MVHVPLDKRCLIWRLHGYGVYLDCFLVWDVYVCEGGGWCGMSWMCTSSLYSLSKAGIDPVPSCALKNFDISTSSDLLEIKSPYKGVQYEFRHGISMRLCDIFQKSNSFYSDAKTQLPRCALDVESHDSPHLYDHNARVAK